MWKTFYLWLCSLRSRWFSDESSESDAEDFISEHSDSSQKSEDDANIDDINFPGSSRISKVLWRNKGPEKEQNMEFTKESGPSEDINL